MLPSAPSLALRQAACRKCNFPPPLSGTPDSLHSHAMTEKPAITITYCRQCNWMLRSAWLAQELLSTFSEEIGSVTLIPGTGGVFLITCDGTQIWERKQDGGFPEAKVLKQRLRNLVWPERDLGHSDGHKSGG